MGSKLKVFILIVVFVVPVSLFLFLKIFGSNTFEIPVVAESVDCLEKKSIVNTNESILLINNQSGPVTDLGEDINQIRRALERYDANADIQFWINAEDSAKFELANKYDIKFKVDTAFNDCLKHYAGSGSKILLLDKQNRLRGTYTVERSEIDRLFTEVDILKLGKEDIVRR